MISGNLDSSDWLVGRLDVGRLYSVDDEARVHVHEITSAEYNIYEEDGVHWLTLFVQAAAELRMEPEAGDREPRLEVNINSPQDLGERIREGEVLIVKSYDEEFFNLAILYYWTHTPFEGQVLIEAVGDDAATARIIGESDDCPVALRAEFSRNPDRRRSFS